MFKNSFLRQHLWWLLLTVLPRHSKVASTCFWFWSKTLTKRCTNNYYQVTKQFLPCLRWLVTSFQFQNMFWKNVNCFRFWWKTYTKRCRNDYVISRVKTFFPCSLWLVRCFQFQGMIWKTEECCKQKYCIKNIAVKILILILLCFCLLCWLKNYLFYVLSLLQLQFFLII